jgi:hydroxyacylglutathione hydrolase
MDEVKVKQFEDEGLAHFSYAVVAAGKMVLIDPPRDPQPCLDYAKSENADIIGIIETHPHADFVSAHLELHELTSAPIYVSSLLGAEYPHFPFDEGSVFEIDENVSLSAMHTPGHSPDGISVLLKIGGVHKAVFTGDTLLIGDVGRPDLREEDGELDNQREKLARMLYRSTREKLMKLDDGVIVYPAHGAGSLCGKSISDAKSSTIGKEKAENPSLQEMTEDEFVQQLLEDQPFVPRYFPYNVKVNKIGAPSYQVSIGQVERFSSNYHPEDQHWIIDGRDAGSFKSSHLPGAINIINKTKFETWLGSIVPPGETFYLVAARDAALSEMIAKSAKIGYEKFIKAGFVYDLEDGETMDLFDKESFDQNPGHYTVLDVRNDNEVKEGKLFKSAIHIPLDQLMDRAGELPEHKPIVVHCGSGYRSAAASSILQKKLKHIKILDMGSTIKDYK